MAEIKLIIPDEKLQRVVDATKWLHPIPQINTGTEEEPVYENEFTDNQWAKEAWRRHIIAQVNRFEIYQAKNAVSIEADDELVA